MNKNYIKLLLLLVVKQLFIIKELIEK